MCISRKNGVPLKGLTALTLDLSCLTFLAATEYLTKATERQEMAQRWRAVLLLQGSEFSSQHPHQAVPVCL